MGNRLPPIVGHWYAHRDKGALFQVVALDEEAGTIEIQEFDGGLDELDLDEWRALAVDSAAQPEDWGGPLDDVEPDEFGYTDLDGDTEPQAALESAITTWEQIVEDDDFDEPIH
ncbi:MAG TPA: DUF6763 family protein [Steroidobacteraceae bacterium]|jgi:hypothetical protein|nr:DUF6763 family protein [Steroidobacteraceae bacterium]